MVAALKPSGMSQTTMRVAALALAFILALAEADENSQDSPNPEDFFGAEGPPDNWRWSKPGYSREMVLDDESYCAGRALVFADADTGPALYRFRCMIRLGYTPDAR